MNNALIIAVPALAMSTVGLANPTAGQLKPSQATQVALDITNNGHVKSCTIVASSGDAQKDKMACDLARVCWEAKTDRKKRAEACTIPPQPKTSEN